MVRRTPRKGIRVSSSLLGMARGAGAGVGRAGAGRKEGAASSSTMGAVGARLSQLGASLIVATGRRDARPEASCWCTPPRLPGTRAGGLADVLIEDAAANAGALEGVDVHAQIAGEAADGGGGEGLAGGGGDACGRAAHVADDGAGVFTFGGGFREFGGVVAVAGSFGGHGLGGHAGGGRAVTDIADQGVTDVGGFHRAGRGGWRWCRCGGWGLRPGPCRFPSRRGCRAR